MFSEERCLLFQPADFHLMPRVCVRAHKRCISICLASRKSDPSRTFYCPAIRHTRTCAHRYLLSSISPWLVWMLCAIAFSARPGGHDLFSATGSLRIDGIARGFRFFHAPRRSTVFLAIKGGARNLSHEKTTETIGENRYALRRSFSGASIDDRRVVAHFE